MQNGQGVTDGVTTRLGLRNPLGALPANPQDLSHQAVPEDKAAGIQPNAVSRPSVFGPATTLGALPNVAYPPGGQVSGYHSNPWPKHQKTKTR